MKDVLNIVAAVLIAAGLVVAVASLLTPGQVILGIDFKLAAILLVGGLILHALASALLQLQRLNSELRQLRKAGSEEPPWLRHMAGGSIAAMAPAAEGTGHDAATADALREHRGDEFAEEVAPEPHEAAAEALREHRDEVGHAGEEVGDEPAGASANQWPVASEVQWPRPAGGALPARQPDQTGEEPDSPFIEPPAWKPETALESEEPAATVSEPEGRPDEADDFEFAEPDARHEADAGAVERDNRGKEPSPLKPSRDAGPRAEEPDDGPAPEDPDWQPGAAADDAELYVVEERMFRGKQARVLSDGTVEAETAEGWMRFEDFEHLEEYLDATAELDR